MDSDPSWGASSPAWSPPAFSRGFAGIPRAGIAFPLAVAPTAMGGLGGALFFAAGACSGLCSSRHGVPWRSCGDGGAPVAGGPCARSGEAGAPVGEGSCCTLGGKSWGPCAGGVSTGRSCRPWQDARNKSASCAAMTSAAMADTTMMGYGGLQRGTSPPGPLGRGHTISGRVRTSSDKRSSQSVGKSPKNPHPPA